jgi:hypothetical protein
METKDNMLEFIRQEANTTRIEKVVDIKIKDVDDSHGSALEHFIVTLKVSVPDFSFTSGNQTKEVDAKCLVNVKQYNRFLEKHNAIIWL